MFSIWGHGTGFSPLTDVPGKYEVSARQAIDRATSKVYRYDPIKDELSYPFFDIADYAHLLAQRRTIPS